MVQYLTAGSTFVTLIKTKSVPGQKEKSTKRQAEINYRPKPGKEGTKGLRVYLAMKGVPGVIQLESK